MRAFLTTAFCLMAFQSVCALYLKPDLTKVPVDKLIENLEERTTGKSAATEDWHHLARAHAMAYAWKLSRKEKVEVEKKSQQPWFGFEPFYVPFKMTKEAEDVAAEALARGHLDKAITAYEKALESNADVGTIRLGYGWCLEQAGKKEDAITAYRAAIKSFWKTDATYTGGIGPIATVEAAGYLAPLLDPKKDAREIADLKAKVAKLEAAPRAITPIAVALGDGATPGDILAPDSSVKFDADGSGRRENWTWITPEAAWLVYDQDGTGRIDSAIQMFGNRTFMLFLDDGYAALRLLDQDGDQQLKGAELENLALWNDRNSNGTSDPDEVRAVGAYGIESIATSSESHPDGILFAPSGVRFRDGSTRATFDVILERRWSPR